MLYDSVTASGLQIEFDSESEFGSEIDWNSEFETANWSVSD
jgi:hypothetical protein